MTVKEFTDKYKHLEVKSTIDELCRNGIGRGCYQDYALLNDILSVLTTLEDGVEGAGKWQSVNL